MNKALYVVVGLLLSMALGYFLFLTILHIGSLFMQSDDDMNSAVVIGLAFWSLIIIVGAYTAYQFIYRRNIEMRRSRYLVYFLVTVLLVIVFDNLIGLASVILGLDSVSREYKQVVVVVSFIVSCGLGVYLSHKWLVKYL